MFIKILQIFNFFKLRETLETYFSVKQYSFLLPFILNNLDIKNLPPSSDSENIFNDIHNLAVSFFILSLLVLFAFSNVVANLTVIILRYKYDLDSKFPKFKWIFKYFEKYSYIWIIIELILCLIILFPLIAINLFLILTIRS